MTFEQWIELLKTLGPIVVGLVPSIILNVNINSKFKSVYHKIDLLQKDIDYKFEQFDTKLAIHELKHHREN